MFERAFRLELPHGICIGVVLPPAVPHADEIASRLHQEELKYARSLAARRRVAWIAGRIAMREALAEMGVAAGPILTGEKGEPVLPLRVVGSISHKGRVAVAVAGADEGWRLGIDIEMVKPGADRLARKILTVEEREQVGRLPSPEARSLETLIRFSLKEALYKAINLSGALPLNLQSASLSLRGAVLVGEDGAGFAQVRFHEKWEESIRATEAHWRVFGETILTTAKVKFFPLP